MRKHEKHGNKTTFPDSKKIRECGVEELYIFKHLDAEELHIISHTFHS